MTLHLHAPMGRTDGCLGAPKDCKPATRSHISNGGASASKLIQTGGDTWTC